ncbi:hypothetical protein P9112_008962 [Eukaryota sp. TZLM1-RC]
MSQVHILDVKILNNPAKFLDPYQFEIAFEAQDSISADDILEFRIVYVGSSKSEEHDQELDVIEISPIPAGTSRFTVETDPPEPSKIPLDDLLGVTVIFVACVLNGKEIVRIGFFCNVHYEDPQAELDEPDFKLLNRNVCIDEPRITVHG